jgi:hypothetical protein
MCLPPNREGQDLFGIIGGGGVDGGSNNNKIDVVQVPLDSCIVGKDLPTLVDKLKYEKLLGPDSEFAPWINLFPTLEDFQSMPRFWAPERIEFVSQYDSGQLKARIDIDQTRIDQQLGGGTSGGQAEMDDRQLTAWALACVDSRSNFLPDETYSLTPLLDMFNHEPTSKTSARIDGDGCTSRSLVLELDSDSVLQLSSSASAASINNQVDYRLQSNSDWKDRLFGVFQGGQKRGDSSSGSNIQKSSNTGREVFISYGLFDNVETLCNYGFVSESNACNLEQFKVRTIGMLGGGGGGGPAILIVDSTGAVDNLFNTMSLDALRLSLANPDELKSYEGTGKISDRNEIEVFALVVGELDEAIYETKQGIAEAKERKDDLVVSYLEGRRRTLQMGLDTLKEKYPDLF